MTDAATTAQTTIRLFLTLSQKYGRPIASRKLTSVGSGIHFGVYESTSLPGLNAVETIQ